MAKVAVLRLDSGSLQTGFEVSLQILEDGILLCEDIEGGKLPPNPALEALYTAWKTAFQHLISQQTRIRGDRLDDWQDGWQDGWQMDESLPLQRASSEQVEACRRLMQSLETSMKDWLCPSADRKWAQVRERLEAQFDRPEEIRLSLRVKDLNLVKLPWHTWDILDRHREVGLGFSFPGLKLQHKPIQPTYQGKQGRVLAVFGNSENINLQSDRAAIEALSNEASIFLFQPSARMLIEHLRDKTGWDIFLFAGHSNTEQTHTKQQTGRIYLNETESLAVEQFKHALQEAARYGLQLAIFNSCRGLGLAHQFSALQIPAIIFMQETVPDEVAQVFLKEFLVEYANGQTLLACSDLHRQATLQSDTFLECGGEKKSQRQSRSHSQRLSHLHTLQQHQSDRFACIVVVPLTTR